MAENDTIAAGIHTIGETGMTRQEILDYLADRDILTSIVYGKSGNKGKCFSVDICDLVSGENLCNPERAHSLEHAVEIAYLEAVRLKWVKKRT